MDSPSRRRLLTTLGAATVALAGCQSGGEMDTLALPAVEVQGVEATQREQVRDRPSGDPALVDFFATWCRPCVPQMAELRGVKEQFPSLHLVSITQESDEAAIRAFWRDNGGTWPVARDPQLRATERYDVTALPTKVLVSADGEHVWHHQGLASADRILRAIDGLEG